MSFRLIHGDSIEVMANAKPESVHAIVCDPPYGIDFMGKAWDKPGEMVGTSLGLSGGFQKFPEGVKRPEMKRSDPHLFQAWCEAWATEAMRVLKPGGHLLAFGGTRMYHRLAAGIEDAGFEVRDCIMWLYGSGFPKSHNVGVNIDKMLGAQRERVAMSGGIPPGSNNYIRDHADGPEAETKNGRIAATPEGEAWNGWGTALKPAVEPIIVARKPLAIPGKRPGRSKKATVAQNVLEHGTGAYNIDGCRVGDEPRVNPPAGNKPGGTSLNMSVVGMPEDAEATDAEGRWPANVIMDEEAGALLGESSRFFYCPKASRSERDAGITGDGQVIGAKGNGLARRCETCSASVIGGCECPDRTFVNPTHKNHHTTVKPIELMRYLVRLVAVEGGVVLDPFMGSGSTGIAALLEGCKFVGIEQDAGYVEIARKRIEHWQQQVAIVDENQEVGATA